ncbi:hypothetical protein H4S06_003953 [Coemansia sp. BCRC 34490]|nr:hypothetical protein H4S06_003953 [Coemansia sp. BCRC 34490]
MKETQQHTGVLEIRFPAYTSGAPPRCTPRTSLAGVVYLQLAEAQAATSLRMQFVGVERILLAPSSVNSNAARVPAGRSKQVSREYFNQSMELWSGRGSDEQMGQLSAGLHMFHFSCEFPRVNYPQSSATEEYEIAYEFTAELLGRPSSGGCGSSGPRKAHTEQPLLAAAQTINFVPETVAPLPAGHSGQSRLGSSSHRQSGAAETADHKSQAYWFSDSANDADNPSQRVLEVQATAAKQAFAPGEAVDMQVRVSGGRPVRRAQFVLYEQTDCFYPQLPEPHEEQLDLGRRLWSSRRAISAKRELPLERDASAGGRGAAHTALLHAALPRDLFVLRETAYLRFTYYAELTFFSPASWSGTVRRAQARVPLPLATRLEAEGAAAALAAHGCAHEAAAHWPAPRLRTDHAASDASRLNRSITDLSARLQQLIPRRQPSASSQQHLPLHSSLRAVSHCARGAECAAPPWLLSPDGSPPVPLLGQQSAAATSSSTSVDVIGQPPRADDASAPAFSPSSALRNQQLGRHFHAPALQALSANGYKGGFSTAFLTRLQELYHADAHRVAVGQLVSRAGGPPGADHGVIPSAMTRLGSSSSPAAATSPAGGRALLGLGSRFNHRSGGSSSRAAHSAERRNSARAAPKQRLPLVDRRLWPRLALVMATHRKPCAAALGSSAASISAATIATASIRPLPTHPAAPLRSDPCVGSPKQNPRFSALSALSALSVSSNDTACVSNGRLSLAKDSASLADSSSPQHSHHPILVDMMVSLDAL